jgi:hypothetical protein
MSGVNIGRVIAKDIGNNSVNVVLITGRHTTNRFWRTELADVPPIGGGN